MTEQFQLAREQEESHLQRVRRWYENGIHGELPQKASLQ